MDRKIEIGWACEHEQFQPEILLEHGVAAEKAGFDFVWVSDHFHPFAHTNAAGGFAWSSLTALAERTIRISVGTSVTCPSFRYHPAIVAQAFATMDRFYPGRIHLGVGTGEPLNETPLGFDWPPISVRIERLREAVKVIRKLWTGDRVTFNGKFWKLKRAKLYSPPFKTIPIYVAAGGPKMAEFAGELGDGIICTPTQHTTLYDNLFPAFERGAKKAGKDPATLERAAEVWVSYDEDYDKALKSTRFWAGALLPFVFTHAVGDPEEIERYGSFVGDEQMKDHWCIGPDIDEHISLMRRSINAGFNKIYIVCSSPDMKKTISVFGKEVLPALRNS
jgi:coenzyme F420-dependent glucose-6-phosphate dehydrogenase